MRFRFRTLPLVLLIGIAIGVASHLLWQRESSGHLSANRSRPEMNLERILPEVVFENVPLDRAAKQLEAASGVPIQIDAASFTQGPVKPTVNVFAHLRHATLAEVLDEITSSVGQYYPELIWYADGQRITIAPSSATSPMVTRVYDVGDILANGRQILDDRSTSDYGLLHLPSLQPVPETRVLRNLMVFVSDSLNPQNGFQSKPSPATARIVGSMLIAYQPWHAHRQLEAHLADLRRMIRDRAYLPAKVGSSSLVERWDSGLNAWIPMSAESVEATMERPVPEFRVKNVTVLQALEELGRATASTSSKS
jgi:hypothetical protein